MNVKEWREIKKKNLNYRNVWLIFYFFNISIRVRKRYYSNCDNSSLSHCISITYTFMVIDFVPYIFLSLTPIAFMLQ